MRIAVTGGSGQIGAYVCDELAGAGHEVACVDCVAPKADVAFVEADLCSLEQASGAIAGFDQVMHLAAIPDPFSDPADRVISVNMAITFNVFEAARRNGIRRVVYGCSDSATGFGIHERPVRPLYVPIDEEHPCLPHECYSLSKYFGEEIGRNYARVFGMEVVSLRYTWVWARKVEQTARRIAAQSARGEFDERGWYGGYVAVRDVARAFEAACRFQFEGAPPFEAFFITARDTFHPIETLEMLRLIYAGLPRVRDVAHFRDCPHASVFDIRKAERLLGWQPQFDWRGIEQWEF